MINVKGSLKRLCARIRGNKVEVVLVTVLLLVVGLAHAINSFHYPEYFQDEGTYMAQAWSFSQHAKLAPYTYWYDHAPVGWMFLALWIKLTGVFTFGFSINSGRVFILLLFILSALFVYLIGRKWTKSKIMASFAMLLFSFAPLTFVIQRQVYLDNIMVFWVLASMALILYSKQRLSLYLLSGLTFGLAILSKESAVFLWPVVAYLVFIHANREVRKQALLMWVMASGLFVLLYPLMAIVKGELLPAASTASCAKRHVSLIGTLEFQAKRGTGEGVLYNLLSNYKSWVRVDPVSVVVGGVSLLVALIIGFRDKPARIIALAGVSYLLFLMRGGEDLYFYILPLMPILALAMSYVLYFVSIRLRGSGWVKWVFFVLFAAACGVLWLHYGYSQYRDAFIYDQTSAEIQAVKWVLRQHTPGQFYAIDMYSYIDLHARNDHNFGRAEYYWKVSADPAIYSNVLHDNYKNINYVIATPSLSADVHALNMYLIQPALKDAKKVQVFNDSGNWPVTIYKVNMSNFSSGKVEAPLNACTT